MAGRPSPLLLATLVAAAVLVLASARPLRDVSAARRESAGEWGGSEEPSLAALETRLLRLRSANESLGPEAARSGWVRAPRPESSLTQNKTAGVCAMYGVCGTGGGPVNCPANTPAVRPNFTLNYCPEYQESACCDQQQYKNLEVNVNTLAGLFARCPACFLNVLTFWCAYTCSKDQSLFVDVLSTTIGNKNKPVVNHTLYTISDEFSNTLFDSCDNVQLGATGQPVMKFIFNSSTPLEFFNFMGEHGPFLIDFNITAAGTSPDQMNEDAFACNTNIKDLRCSCGDCPALCSSCNFSEPNLRIEAAPKLRVGDNYVDVVNVGLFLSFLAMLGALMLTRASHAKTPAARALLLSLGAATMVGVALMSIYMGVRYEAEKETVQESIESITGPVPVAAPPANVHVLGSYVSFALFLPLLLWAALLLIILVVVSLFCMSPAKGAATPPLGGRGADSSNGLDGDANGARSTLLGHVLERHEEAHTVKPGSLATAVFSSIAHLSANYPKTVIFAGLLFTGLSALGLLRIHIETDPIALWVPPGSQSLVEKDRFDSTFGPFYRVEQLIFTAPPGELFTPVYLKALRDLQLRVQSVTAEYEGETVTFETVCNRPIPGNGCMVQSVTEYFFNTGGIPDNITEDEIRAQVGFCVAQVANSTCRASNGAVIVPNVALAGYPLGTINYLAASAYVTTWPVNNDAWTRPRAEAWEREVLKVLRAGVPGLPVQLAYSTERSLQDELNRQGASNIPAVVLSYIVMFAYISLALGRVFPLSAKYFCVRTRFMLGTVAIAVVLCSVVIAIGLCSAAGVKMTPIISEVIPFLVLAIGIDNVFIILNHFNGQDPSLSIESRLANSLSAVGVSITLASLSEAFAFALGVLTRMPAVQSFAVYSAAAILADYVLQISVFTAAIVLDARRRERGRFDCCPCFGVEDAKESLLLDYEPAAVHDDPSSQPVLETVGPAIEDLPHGLSELGDDLNGSGARRLMPKDGVLKRFMRRAWVPIVLHRAVKMVVLASFFGFALFCAGYAYSNLQLGLENSEAVPSDSYLQDYFTAISTVLRTGPPLYFVVQPNNHTNFSLVDNQDRVCASFACPETSLLTLAKCAGEHSMTSYLSGDAGVNSWIDDYFSFLESDSCCVINDRGEYCPPNATDPTCSGCDVKLNKTNERPSPANFSGYLGMFLTQSQCSLNCSSCGWGHYTDVVLAPNQRDTQSTRFMGFHTVLQTQSDFIGSLREARKLASHISAVNQLDVYVYSSFYVYFEQYLYIEGVAALSMGLAATAIFALSLVILRNLFASLLILSTIAMILVDLFGVMALWSISLNAVSAVNLSMAIGISVEFCIHVTVAFLRSRGSRDFRVAQALIGVGSSVVSGITLTKFLGVIALIAAPSAIFRVYYFRMYFAIVLLGASHGLIFLPVLLSLVGPRTLGSDADAEADADADGKRGASAVPSDSAGDLYASLKDDGR